MSIVKILKLFLITVLLSIATLELSYREQWFDFYKPELLSLNTPQELESEQNKILVCGDSFSASPESYVSVLRDSLSSYAVINAAIPGTGIRQHALVLPGRIKAFKPKIFLYQFYVGNDLFDISHPWYSHAISITRKMYWFVSDRILSFAFLNFRFAGVRYKFFDDAGGGYNPKEYDLFSAQSYSKREKFNYLAEPALIENTLHLKHGRERDWKIFKDKFTSMAQYLDPSAKRIFVIIPHESQWSQQMQIKHNMLGAVTGPLLSTDDYPLYKEIYKLCNELNFEVFDFRKEADLTGDKITLYYPNDPHLTPAGHQLLGKLILKRIRR
jgi:hypothetical protein